MIFDKAFFPRFFTKPSEACDDIANAAKVFYFLTQWSTGIVTGPGTSPEDLSEAQIPYSGSVDRTSSGYSPAFLVVRGPLVSPIPTRVCEPLPMPSFAL